LSVLLCPSRELSIATLPGERSCAAKNRMRELRSCGSVRAEGSNALGYSETSNPSAKMGLRRPPFVFTQECLWRLERFEEAEALFMRLLWMCPSDNLGTRFLLPPVRARRTWTPDGP
jgi:hypothetical protein